MIFIRPPRLKAVLLASCLWLAPGWLVQAATYFVAQHHSKASDSGPGTTEQPWKSLHAAAEHVTAGDRVLILDGEYREAVVVNSSGKPGAQIRFEAAPGAHVVVTGAD